MKSLIPGTAVRVVLAICFAALSCVVSPFGQVHELDQSIGDFVHRRDDHGFSRTLLRAHDGRDVAIAFGIGQTCAAKLMNNPSGVHGRSSRKVFSILDSIAGSVIAPAMESKA